LIVLHKRCREWNHAIIVLGKIQRPHVGRHLMLTDFFEIVK